MAGGWFLCLSWGLNTILPASAGPQLSPPSCVALGKSLYSVSQFPHLWAGFTTVPTSVCGGPMGFTERGHLSCQNDSRRPGRGPAALPRGRPGREQRPPHPGAGAARAAAPPAGRFLPSPPPRTPASERKPPGPGGRPFLSASSFPHSARGSGPRPTGRAERRGRAAAALRDRLGQARGRYQRGQPRARPQARGSRRPPAHGTGCPCVQAPRRQTPPGCGARGAPRLPSQHALHLPPPAQGHHPTGGRCDHRHFTDEKN